ncbi:MAG TPA: ATP-binding protein [Candidatus Paceibacterota bacterium]|nr:ATP-binding protein [Candidatus Paceibacterota bacterium]
MIETPCGTRKVKRKTMKSKILRYDILTWAAFGLTLIILILSAVFSYHNFKQLQEKDALVDDAHGMLDGLDSLLADLDVSVGAERAYLLTGNQAYFSSYESATQRIDADLDTLTAFASEDPERLRGLSELRPLVTERLAGLGNGIAAREEASSIVIPDALQTGAGEAVTSRIVSLAGAMRQSEVANLATREAAAAGSYAKLATTIASVTLLDLLLLFATVYFFYRYERQNAALARDKDEFIGRASHELKSPLTTQTLYLHMLQRFALQKNDVDLAVIIGKIQEHTTDLTNLVTDLLDLSRMQLGTFDIHRKEDVDLDGIVHDILDGLQAIYLNRAFLLHGEITCCVPGDPERIGQAITNILMNAVKYSPADQPVEVDLREVGDEVLVSVRDHGIGIDSTHHVSIFKRFYRVSGISEETFPGLGIGLYISSKVIERHGGRITVESAPGKGSEFTVALPAA